MGIHCEERGRIEPTEFASGIDMFVDKLKLADQPHDFLDIE